MDHSLDGHGLSRAQLQAKAEAAASTGQLDGDSGHNPARPARAPRPDGGCEWRGDAPDPELDDLAHTWGETQQSTRPVDTCDWRGDKPEQHEDDLGRICQPPPKSDRRNKPVEDGNPVQMPTPRSSKMAGIPETLLPTTNDKSPDRKHDPQAIFETPTRDEKQFEHGRRPSTKKRQDENPVGPSNAPRRGRGAVNQSPTEGRTHSPWVDSLEQLPATMIEKVNRGVKETLEAAASILSPATQNEPPPQEPTPMEKPQRRSSGLAPVTAAPPPADSYIPTSAQPPNGPLTAPDEQGDNKKQKRERSRSEKKVQREARRKSKQQKTKEKKETRKEEKEMRRKEKEWKKIAKKGGELPLHLRLGLRLAPGSKVPYTPKCDICTKAAASAMSSKKRDPKCTMCAKAAEHESTDQYLKSLKVNLVELPSLDDLLDTIKRVLDMEKRAQGNGAEEDINFERGSQTSHQTQSDQELLEHILLHIRDFATNGGEHHLRGRKCNQDGQPGHLGRHGLDGNRDSPTTTDSEHTISNSSSNSGSPTMSSPPAVDWWVRAMSSKELPSTPYCSSSPLRAPTPLRRPKTTVYDARTAHCSVPKLDGNSAAYHFYLPFAVCHNCCCSPGQSSGLDNWRAPFRRSFPSVPQGYSSRQGMPVLRSGWAETLPSDTPRPSQDGIYHPRSRSGSI